MKPDSMSMICRYCQGVSSLVGLLTAAALPCQVAKNIAGGQTARSAQSGWN